MPRFDLLIRGGLVVDGTGEPGRPADVAIDGDRIAAIGDLSAVEPGSATAVIDADGRMVAPGFIDIHGHSDASVLVDGALVSHLQQGFTTQLSGNCGLSVAPLGEHVLGAAATELGAHGVRATWRTFAAYLEAVEAVELGPNVAFLAGHGAIRTAVLGPEARTPTRDDAARMVAELEAALEAGAFGLSSGLIYAPGVHAAPDELARLAAVAARRGGLYATHLRDEAVGFLDAIDEATATIRAAGDGARLQIAHLKAGARAVWGRADDAVARLEAARRDGLDVAADQYPYPTASTDLAVVLPPELTSLARAEVLAALADEGARARVRREIALGRSGWPDIASDPGWAAIRVSWSPRSPKAAGWSIAELADERGRDEVDVALDLLAEDGLATAVLVDCVSEADIETILGVPWIAIATDAEGRRPGHPILDAGLPHPRTYGTTARVLGRYVRERGLLDLETAVAKLSGVPAGRLGLTDRGTVREGAFADLVVFDAGAIRERATAERPARHPAGIDAVVVNGVVAIREGQETGARPGRLLRRPG